jgi:hypothetical protein
MLSDLPVLAVQVTYSNVAEIAAFIRDHGGAVAGLRWRADGPLPQRGIWIGTLSGIEEAYVGDWIVRGRNGEFTIHPAATFPGASTEAHAADGPARPSSRHPTPDQYPAATS